MDSGTSAGGGIGFCGLLTVVFITLRLTGVIDWSWAWVLAPIWIPVALVLSVLVLLAFIAVIVMVIEAAIEGRRQ